MRMAYATTYDATDVHAWSGLGYHIARCLELGGISVDRLGPLSRKRQPLARARQLEAKLRGGSYELDRDPAVARAYAAQVERKLRSTDYDMVFSPGTIPIAHLDTELPVAFWADATFASMLRSYAEFRALGKRAIRAGFDLEARALERAGACFYASLWAAESAVEDHGADPKKTHVLPFGANMRIMHDRDDVVSMVCRRPADICRLLFVGVDWARKGGDRALEVARILNDRGLPTELHVVGSAPERDAELPSWLHLHGFVDKSTEPGASLMRKLFESSHVLIHPATAEAFGVVFCEAAGHGVVSVASRVGGIPSAVREGITGVLCSPTASTEVYADCVWRLIEDRSRYESMAVGAFDEYQRSLSWEAQAVRLKARLDELA
jgi:glycosyltransferase involved in cell wall biosynthesis